MKISMIWAMDKNDLIGNGANLPWHLPNDLKYFKKTTEGKPVVMGLTTYHSIGKALPNRRNVVLSFDDIDLPDAEVYTSIDDAMKALQDEDEIFIIGGRSIYKQFLEKADRLYVTFIDHEFEGDIHFPEVDWTAWDMVSETAGKEDEKNRYAHYFRVYERIC